MPLSRPGLPLATCCCCCGACCTPPPGVAFTRTWLPCSGSVFDPAGELAVDLGDIGWVQALEDTLTPPATVVDNTMALIDCAVLSPGAYVSTWSADGGALGCPCAIIPAVTGKGGGGLVAQALEDGESLWFLADVPDYGVSGASMLVPNGTGPFTLWAVGAFGGVLVVTNADFSTTLSAGIVSAGQTVLVGLEYDTVTPSFRVAVNGVDLGDPGFASIPPAVQVAFVSSVNPQGSWPLYFAGRTADPWDDVLAAMSAWMPLAPLIAP